MKTFSKEFFTGNRKRLAKALPSHLLVFAGHSLLQSSVDMAFPFRQDSSFWYLTGIKEPDLLVVIDTDTGETTLLLPDQNDYQKEWDGAFDTSGLKKTSGVEHIAAHSELASLLKEATKKGQKTGYLPALSNRVEPYGFYANPARRNLEKLLESNGVNLEEANDVRREVARLRQIKQSVELAAIKCAISVTGDALADIKSDLQSMKNESDIERRLSAAFYLNGDGHSFSPIVASGKNAATIHYEKNDAVLKDGLLLLDVGAQVDNYASDISRTWVVGKPTKRQKEVWQACLAIQEKGFELLSPGAKIREIQEELEQETEKQLEKLGTTMPFDRFPHGFSHFMGIDPHDAGDYDEPLKPGSVITMEPGLYLPDEGIGVRIEDDVLITKNGIEILSKDIPKTL